MVDIVYAVLMEERSRQDEEGILCQTQIEDIQAISSVIGFLKS